MYDAIAFFAAFCLAFAINHMVSLILDALREKRERAAAKAKINEDVFKTFKHRKKDRDDDEK